MHSVKNTSYNQDVNDIQEFPRQMSKLNEDIRCYYEYTNKKRTKYKYCVQGVNVVVSVLYPLVALSVALSFLEGLQVFMKVFSLLFSTIGVIVPLVAKGLAWNENLQQRTVTYLRLDELMRDMRYEKSFDEKILNRYVERYKTIVSEDNKMGLGNVAIMQEHSENVTKGPEKK